MEKQISAIRRKMIIVIFILIVLTIWQHEFIVKGVLSHMQINLTILGTGAFGVITAFHFVSKLGNEVTAFRALKEMSDDIRRTREGGGEDPSWQYARCAKPAQVFSRPRLLGHAYDLVTEELGRTRKIRISVETMNTLVHKIESSINDEKSLIVYISGLLVFMGLIGTFIGLLHMVSAIGGIIGSLSKTTDVGPGAFSELLGALEEPLKGMASGFASSLFGLFCSLLVGLMARFAGQAAGVLKANFEAWLAGVVQLSDAEIAAETASDGHVVALAGAPVADAVMMKLVTGLLGDYGKVAGTFADAAKSLKDIRAGQATQAELTLRVAEAVAQAGATQAQMQERLAAQAPLKDTIEEFGRGLQSWLEHAHARQENESARAHKTFDALNRVHNEDLRLFAQRQAESSAQIVTAIAGLSATLARLSHASTSGSLEAAVERGLARAQRQGVEDLRLAATEIANQVERGFSQWRGVEDAHRQALLSALREHAPGADGASLGGIEATLGDGLDRIGQSVEAALSAYASLARVALAALERTQASAPASDDDPAYRRNVSGAA